MNEPIKVEIVQLFLEFHLVQFSESENTQRV